MGFLTLKTGSFLAKLFKRKKEDKLEEISQNLGKEHQDLSYLSSSIDFNLSHNRGRGKSQERRSQGPLSVFYRIFNWLKGINKKWLYGAIAVLIILAVAGGIYMRVRSQASNSSELSTIVSAAQEKINSADTQAALRNETEAKKLLLEAKSMLEGIKDKPKSPVEVVILLEKIEEKIKCLE